MYDRPQQGLAAGAARQFETSGYVNTEVEPRNPAVRVELDRLHGVSEAIMKQLQDLQQRLSPVLSNHTLTGISGGKDSMKEPGASCDVAEQIRVACSRLNACSDMLSQIYSRLEV